MTVMAPKPLQTVCDRVIASPPDPPPPDGTLPNDRSPGGGIDRGLVNERFRWDASGTSEDALRRQAPSNHHHGWYAVRTDTMHAVRQFAWPRSMSKYDVMRAYRSLMVDARAPAGGYA